MTPLRIAYLGPEGSYSHRATCLLFNCEANFDACQSFEDIFKKVEDDQCEYGVLPIENNTAGIVNEAIDLLISLNYSICAEYSMSVQHALLAHQSCELKDIETLFSMTQPYYQSKNFVDKHLRHANWVQTRSSSDAMNTCLEAPHSAAIGFADSGLKLGLKVIEDHIQNRQDNATRFFVLSKDKNYNDQRQASQNIRSTLVFTLKDEPGSLLSILQIFKDAGINMCHIESRRTPLPEWNYYFFITLETESNTNVLDETLQNVRKITPWNRFLGHYPVLL